MIQQTMRTRTGQAFGWSVLRTLAQVGAVAEPEPVRMLAQRFGFLPDRFLWRGTERRVREVVRSWDRAGSTPRRYFAVICADGAHCTLMQELRVGTWYLA